VTLPDALLTIVPVTVSPLSIAVVLLALVGKRGMAAAGALVAGWAVGAWAVLLLAMLGVLRLGADDGGGVAGLAPMVQLGLGVAALVIGVAAGVRAWQHARHGQTTPEMARLAQLADALTPPRAAVLGFVLVAASPRQWVFLIPAAAGFAAADVPGGTALLPLLGAAVATVGVAAPLVVAWLVERRRHGALDALRAWWTRRGDLVGAAAAAGVGVVLVLGAR
jgi:hypothetical protein